MKIIILEANKEELAANKRVADVIVDTLTTFLDNFAKLNNNYDEDDDYDDYDDED